MCEWVCFWVNLIEGTYFFNLAYVLLIQCICACALLIALLQSHSISNLREIGTLSGKETNIYFRSLGLLNGKKFATKDKRMNFFRFRVYFRRALSAEN